MLKVIIAGGREFKNYPLLCKVCDHMLKNHTDIEIVSGKADGADYLGERYARERGYPIKPFPAPWNDVAGKPQHEIGRTRNGKLYWKLAGPFRNKQMGEYGDCLIAFWDKKSTGTKNMIEIATEKQLKIKIQHY